MIYTIFFIFIVILAIWAVSTSKAAYQETILRQAIVKKTRDQAHNLIRKDARLVWVIMLLSYSDMEDSTSANPRRKSNKRLVLEAQQITRLHMPLAPLQEVNMVVAQLLIISKNIGKKRNNYNASVPVPKRK